METFWNLIGQKVLHKGLDLKVDVDSSTDNNMAVIRIPGLY